ncbi:hypothetical protein CAC42_2241 [Sphaceloma murrayae]|uniref:SP-RING-type domain-containing protein n=1 Tax=Sphaceloma murrayae TaxID=2082308 RepID=A0A2K1QJD8_9PEZI|nr:hypothetical protein CAC42_2241 [Sphaceloma murrayae]
MPSRIISRPSGAGQSTNTPTQHRDRNRLPDYQPVEFPLTAKAQQQLSSLIRRHPLNQFDAQLDSAIANITENMGAINDHHANNAAKLTSRQEKLNKLVANNAASPRIQAERTAIAEATTSLATQKDKVDTLTASMEKQLREMIDLQQQLIHTRDTLKDLTNTTSASSQRPSPRASAPESTFDPTDPTNSTPSSQPLASLFKSTLDSKTDRYNLLPLSRRYASNNSYRKFRTLLHDARHQHDDAPPPPPSEDTWFSDRRPAPGETGGLVSDDDDDVAVARESVSTRCPVTLQEFVEPVTSRKCPHSFEEAAIFEMIGKSTITITVREGHSFRDEEGTGKQAKAVQCPVPGCERMLTKRDLERDFVLKRRVERVRRAREVEDEEEEEEEEEEEDEDEGEQEEGEAGKGNGRGRKRRSDVVDVESGEEEEEEEEKEEAAGSVRTGTARRRRLKVSQEL